MTGENEAIFQIANQLIEEEYQGVDMQATGNVRIRMDALQSLARLVMSERVYRKHLADIAAGCKYSASGQIIAGPREVLEAEFAYAGSEREGLGLNWE